MPEIKPEPPGDDIAMADIDEAPPPSPKDAETASRQLEALFDSDDSDEEFPTSSSMPVKPAPSSPPLAPLQSIPAVSELSASDPDVLRLFYQRLFPWRPLFQWLNHRIAPSSDFAHREFAFTLQNDVYLRYQSFRSHDQLRSTVLRLLPSRFEIGPVYSLDPRDRRSNPRSFKPVTKELCFDIDLTDYDDVRTCCAKAQICRRCWTFITNAIRVVDIALRDDFGFRHILWIYSGRRGAHAWVCDRKARNLDDGKRRAIAGYLEVVRGGAQAGKKVNLWRPLHPHITRSLDLLRQPFLDILNEQEPWFPDPAEISSTTFAPSESSSTRLLRLLPDSNLRQVLERKWSSEPGRSSLTKWNDIDVAAKAGALKKASTRDLLEAKQDVLLEYSYPRLDIEVSKKLNHLLKSPFVVHPGTGRVCVPIDTRSEGTLADFDPLSVPTVQQLIKEIDEWQDPHITSASAVRDEGDQGDQEIEKNGHANGNEENGRAATKNSNRKPVQDWEKTSLKPYIDLFRVFIAGLLKDEQQADTKARKKEEKEKGVRDAMQF